MLANQFKDLRGDVWTLAVTLGSARRLKNEVGVDLGNIGDGRLFLELATDPYKFGSVLWVLLESQAASRSVSLDDFLDRIDGDVVDAAVGAFGAALVNFTPPPLRGAVARVLEKTRTAQAAAMSAVEEWIEKQPTTETAVTETTKALSHFGTESPS